MKLKVAETTYRDVELSESQVEGIVADYLEQTILKNGYIAPNGVFFEYDYTHPHNGKDHYKDRSYSPTALEQAAQDFLMTWRTNR